VVGVDRSDEALSALKWAVDEAGLRGARLLIVHARTFRSVVFEMVPGSEMLEQALLDAVLDKVRQWNPSVEASATLVEPPAAKALVEMSGHASVLVVGSRGMGRIREFELGSVSHECAIHAKCPVVIVKAPARPSGAREVGVK
jgi:nucleotide-binding universal stress UspA family protein